mmetsp:Transcript_6853/g.5646  ORF Transcript_6853/g.5646 Transcript_6853/m.5646 type:complete len:98 (+) Transcript_6853:167-460(+)
MRLSGRIMLQIYWFLFAYVDKRADIHSVEDDMQTTVSSSTNNSVSSSLSFSSIKVAMLMAGGIIANLTAVYFLEYWRIVRMPDWPIESPSLRPRSLN